MPGSNEFLTLQEERGFTRKGLAAAAGVSPRDIGRIQRGALNPTLQTLDRLVRALRDDVPSRGRTETAPA